MVNEEVLWPSLMKARSSSTMKEQNTQPSKGVVLESHCKTMSLDQRQNKGTRKKLAMRPKHKNQSKKELVPNGQKEEERLLCRRVLKSGKDVAEKSKPLNLE